MMMYIEEVGSLKMNKKIPIWTTKDSVITIYEPLVSAPISDMVTVDNMKHRTGNDEDKMLKVLTESIADSIENRCVSWNKVVADKMVEEVKVNSTKGNFIENVVNLLFDKDEIDTRSRRWHLFLGDQDKETYAGETRK